MRLPSWIHRLTGWNIRYGELWMLQWQLNGWLSLGIHLDFKRRSVSGGRFQGLSYGPYFDLHLGVLILSLGWRPYLSGGLMNESGIARGGESVVTDEDMIVEKISWSFTRFVELLLIVLLIFNVWRETEIRHIKQHLDDPVVMKCSHSPGGELANRPRALHCIQAAK